MTSAIARPQAQDKNTPDTSAPDKSTAGTRRGDSRPRRQTGRRALVVLGPHRSGTSALTRVLSLCGAQLPAHILQAEDGLPNDGNSQAGFWESRPLMLLHEEAMRSAGSTWDDPHEVPAAWLESEAARELTQRLADTLDEEYGDAPLIIAKDPRISRLAPLWVAALKELDFDTSWLIAVRNPFDVAASLNRRDGFPQAKGLLLWLTHFLPAERHTRGHDRLFVLYDDLLEDWRRIVGRVEADLGFSFARRSHRAGAEIDRFLDYGLRHHATPKQEVIVREDLAQWVKEAYEWSFGAAAGNSPDSARLDGITAELQQAELLYGPMLAAAEIAAEQLRDENEKLRREAVQYAELQKAEAKNSERIAALEEALARERENANALGQRLEALNEGLSAERGRADEKERKLEELAQRLNEGRGTEGVDSAAVAQRLAELEEAWHQQQATDLGASTDRVKVLAFYLPQFHPIPENDKWWGKGFTEWTNVTAAQPCFAEHDQPLLPSELGFYDLRVPGIRQQQADLAREHGIHGFCYYYYWFHGEKLLEHPLEEVLRTQEPDFPFCICWANENWTRRWDGEDDQILIAQEHSPESDQRFIDDVMPLLLDPRYIRHNGSPVVLVYRADLLADPLATTTIWREAARQAGLPGLHLCAVWQVENPLEIGFDALIEFPPHHFLNEDMTHNVPNKADDFGGTIFDYEAGVDAVRALEDKGFPQYRGVMPSWDNTARRKKNASIFHGSRPELYQKWLEKVLRETRSRPGNDDQFVFINAWNEWAEGAALEPSRNHGRAYLQATRNALEASRVPPEISALWLALDRVDEKLEEMARSNDRVAPLQFDVRRLQAEQQESREFVEAISSENRVALDWLRDGHIDHATDLKGHQEALQWLHGVVAEHAERLDQLATSAPEDGVREEVEDLRNLVAARTARTPPGGLWLNPRHGVLGLGLKLPLWALSGRLKSRLKWWRQTRHVLLSGLFDAEYYQEQNPEVAEAGIDPLYHYVRYGAAQGLDPNPFFNSREYVEQYPEAADEIPLLHFARHGVWQSSIPPQPVLPESVPPQSVTPESVAPQPVAPQPAPVLNDVAADAVAPGWTFNPAQLERRSSAANAVLCISHDAARAGAQIYLLEVLKTFCQQADLELFVLLCGGGELRPDFERYAHVLDLQENGGVLPHVVDTALGMMGREPAVVLSNTVASSQAAKILAERGLPVVSIVHELPTTIAALGEESIRETVHASREVIIVSNFVRDAIVRQSYGIPEERLRVRYVGVTGWEPENERREDARQRILARHGLSEETVLVLGCGSIHHRKGPDLFVQVARDAIHNYGVDQAVFLWVGGDQLGPLFRSWCEHDIAAAGLQEKILFTGQMDSAVDYYLAADVFLLTSREDPFPLVNLEAMARGLPVVAFEGAGGASEALTDGAGVVVPYLDTAEMTRALVRLVEAPRYRAEVGEKARARAHEKFRWERFSDELRGVLMQHRRPLD